MPKPLRRQAKGLVISLIEYFERECRNGGPLLPLESIRERVADALKLSLVSVNRLSAKAKSGQLLASPSKQRPRNKPTTEINPSQQAEVRNVIYEMYQQKKPITLSTLACKLKDPCLYTGSSSSLWRILQKIGFKWQKDNPRRGLMELSHMASKRITFLKAYLQYRESDLFQFVFLDETWIFQDGTIGRSWQNDSIKSVRRTKVEGKRCKFKCTEKFSELEKRSILKSLYSGKPKNEQDTYLMGLLECKGVKWRRSRNQEPKQERRCNFVFYVLHGKDRVKVCKKAFLSLYALSSKAVFRLTSLLLSGNKPVDRRGQHIKRGNAIPDSSILKINEHISSFPKKETHYASKPVTYLDSQLTVKKNYEMFCQENAHLSRVVKYEYYLKHFNENFGYRFDRPQVDVYPTCEELGVKLKSSTLNDNAKRVATAELLVHKRRTSKFYKKIEDVRQMCIQNENVGAIVFDYMQNLPIPFMPVNDMFYLRKLWQYIFGIHDLKTSSATFYTYFEGTAKRGANEVATFLQDYINTISESVTELHVFSDACGGQNRNHTIIRFLSTLSMNGRFKSIHQYFPVRGHSFLPCDRDFGLIKSALRRHDRIFTPMEYVSIIANAKKSKASFIVKVVNTDEVMDFKSWWPIYFKKSTKEISAAPSKVKQNFNISKYRHITYDSEFPGYVLAKEFIDGLNASKFSLSKGVIRPPFPSENAYENKIPIKAEKLKDLAKVIGYIPNSQQEFFRQFQDWPTTNREYDSE